jgi:hypothetical protein
LNLHTSDLTEFSSRPDIGDSSRDAARTQPGETRDSESEEEERKGKGRKKMAAGQTKKSSAKKAGKKSPGGPAGIAG